MAQNVASGDPVAPAGGERTILIGPVSGAAPHVIVSLANPVSAGMSVDVYTHPVGPPPPGGQVGTYYPFATAVAIATAAIGPGEQAVLIRGGEGRTFRQMGLTIVNNDTPTHDVSVDVLSTGDGAEA